MSSEENSITELETFINHLIEKQGKRLNPTEQSLVRGILQGSSYESIAKEQNLSHNYVACSLAPKLFQRISGVLGCRVGYRNLKSVLQKAYQADRTACSQTDGSRVVIELLDPPDPSILKDLLQILTQKAGLNWNIRHLES